MQNITAFNTSGIFNASSIALDNVTDASLKADLGDAKDEILVLVDIPSSVTGDTSLVFAPVGAYEKGVSVLLSTGINHILITTKGIKGDDGYAEFSLENSNGTAAGSLGAKMCFIKHTNVINH